MNQIKLIFSAVIPSILIAIVTTICAGFLSALSFSLSIFFMGLLKSAGLEDAMAGGLVAAFFAGIPIFYFTVIFSFIPNIMSIFIIFYKSLAEESLLDRVLKVSVYRYGSIYGLVIYTIAFLAFVMRDVLNAENYNFDIESVSRVFLMLLPAAILSGIFVLKSVKVMLDYKVNK